jgi:MFS family permease
MESPGPRRSARPAVATVALATALNPLNTSMVPIALTQLQRVFGTSTSESTWLLSAFALASAVGHPLAGGLADRLGARRVLMAGLVITGASGLAASYAATFPVLVALRAVQALGTSTAFPAGIALLRMIDAPEGSNRPLPAAWLGAVAMSCNLTAALGPVLGGALIATVGWHAIFLVNLPIAIAVTVLVWRHFPADREHDRRARGPFVRFRTPAAHGPLLSVYARFAAVCTVFYAVFFALPLWLEQTRGLSAAVTGAMMLPLASVSALTTPIAIRTVSQSGFQRALVFGASGLCLGTGLLATVGTQTPIVAPLAALVALGASHAFNNLGLQAELSCTTSPRQLGTAAGLFQTARFVGAALAAGLVGIIVANDALTDSLHRLWIAVAILSFALLVWATRSTTGPMGGRRFVGSMENPEGIG